MFGHNHQQFLNSSFLSAYLVIFFGYITTIFILKSENSTNSFKPFIIVLSNIEDWTYNKPMEWPILVT